jgi:hypothetical protein
MTRKSRSKLSNETVVMLGADQRSSYVRYFRDLQDSYALDYGGRDNLTEAEKALIRRVCILEIEMQRLETNFAIYKGGQDTALDLYRRCGGSQAALLKELGLKRRSKDVTPTFSEYIKAKAKPTTSDDGVEPGGYPTVP